MKIKLKTFEQAVVDAKSTAFGVSDTAIVGLTNYNFPWGKVVDAEFQCDSDMGKIFKVGTNLVPAVCFDFDDESFDYDKFDYTYNYNNAVICGKTLSDDEVDNTRIRTILWDNAIWHLKEVNGKLYYYNKLHDVN